MVNPADDEELALILNGRKKKLKRKDFEAAMTTLKLDSQQQQNFFRKMEKAWPAWEQWIDMSFLTEDYKFQYKSVIQERLARLR